MKFLKEIFWRHHKRPRSQSDITGSHHCCSICSTTVVAADTVIAKENQMDKKITIKVDTADLDATIKKANQLLETLKEIEAKAESIFSMLQRISPKNEAEDTLSRVSISELAKKMEEFATNLR